MPVEAVMGRVTSEAVVELNRTLERRKRLAADLEELHFAASGVLGARVHAQHSSQLCAPVRGRPPNEAVRVLLKGSDGLRIP